MVSSFESELSIDHEGGAYGSLPGIQQTQSNSQNFCKRFKKRVPHRGEHHHHEPMMQFNDVRTREGSDPSWWALDWARSRYRKALYADLGPRSSINDNTRPIAKLRNQFSVRHIAKRPSRESDKSLDIPGGKRAHTRPAQHAGENHR